MQIVMNVFDLDFKVKRKHTKYILSKKHRIILHIKVFIVFIDDRNKRIQFY
jgi:hypothetical protein